MVAAMVTGLSGNGSPADAATVPVPNSSFEEGWLNGKLKCWHVDPASGAKFSVTAIAPHSGQWAAHVQGRGRANSQVKLASDRTEACKIPAVPGRRYRLSFWTRSTAGVQPVVATYSAAAGWVKWFTGTEIPASATLGQHAVDLPAVPNGVSRINIGLTLPGNSTAVVDDVELSEHSTALFQPDFSQSGLVTNEFAYWNPGSPLRVESADWEMTSGSLFARNGNGYSGKIDAGAPDAQSATNTGSAIFRLNTRDFTFGDVRVAMKLKITRFGATTRTPAVDWDGVHLFLRYQSQYSLYYASVARRDGHVVIKKKCPGGPSNNGTYYSLDGTEEGGHAFPLGSWQDVGATIRTNANGSVTITLLRGGDVVATGTDSGVGCAAITSAGASGIRGDNAEFDFADFTVAAAN
jgi:hypothetical protein